MKKAKPYIVASIIIALIGFLLWSVFAPKNDIKEVINRKLEQSKERSDVSFTIVTFSEIDNGTKYWELNAASSTINKTTGVANLRSVDGLFFQNGRSSLKFIAPRAVWNLDKKEIHLIEPIGYDTKSEKEILAKIKQFGGIRQFISYFSLPSDKSEAKTKGYWFKAKNLEWKLSTKKLYCEGGITLTKGDVTIRSKNLEADVGLEKVILTGDPYATLSSSKDRSKIHISSDSFLVDSLTDKIYANSNVSIKSDSAVITSLNAVYDQINKDIDLIKDVNVKTKKIHAWGDSARYSTTDYIAEISGNACATRDKSKLCGDKIIVLTEDNKLFVIGRSKATIDGSIIDKLN